MEKNQQTKFIVKILKFLTFQVAWRVPSRLRSHTSWRSFLLWILIIAHFWLRKIRIKIKKIFKSFVELLWQLLFVIRKWNDLVTLNYDFIDFSQEFTVNIFNKVDKADLFVSFKFFHATELFILWQKKLAIFMQHLDFFWQHTF